MSGSTATAVLGPAATGHALIYRFFWFWELEGPRELDGCPNCKAVAINKRTGKCLGCGQKRPTVS